MHLTDRVHLVGSGRSGADISNSYDCHVYLIDGGHSLGLIDAGAGIQPDLILKNINEAGFDPNNVDKIVLTHAHADHAGGAASLQEVTGAEVLAPGPSATWLVQADETAISLPRARAGGTYPADYRLKPCAETTSLTDGDIIQIGDSRLETIATSGHAAVHVSFLLDDDNESGLFGGDIVFQNGKILLLATPDCSIQALITSMHRLSKLDFDALFPGHGGISLHRGHRHVDAALRVFDAGRIPPNYEV